MRRLYLNFLILSAIAFAPSAFAQSQKTDIRPQANRLLDIDLELNFTGQTHAGAYNFTAEGEPTRFYEERHYKDGTVAYSEGNGKQTGIWRTFRNKLCYVYDGNQTPGGCFRVYRVANCYYFYSANLIERQDELDQDYWTARSTIKGETPKCEAALS